MRALVDLGPSPIRDFARHASTTHSAASQTIAQMARKGLLRLKAGTDARERVVHLTPRARRMLPKLQAQWAATEAAAEGLSAELPCPLHDVLIAAIHVSVPANDALDKALALARAAIKPSARR